MFTLVVALIWIEVESECDGSCQSAWTPVGKRRTAAAASRRVIRGEIKELELESVSASVRTGHRARMSRRKHRVIASWSATLKRRGQASSGRATQAVESMVDLKISLFAVQGASALSGTLRWTRALSLKVLARTGVGGRSASSVPAGNLSASILAPD